MDQNTNQTNTVAFNQDNNKKKYLAVFAVILGVVVILGAFGWYFFTRENVEVFEAPEITGTVQQVVEEEEEPIIIETKDQLEEQLQILDSTDITNEVNTGLNENQQDTLEFE